MPVTRQSQLDANRRWREKNAAEKREMDRVYREKNKETINAKIAEKRKSGEYKRSRAKYDAAYSKMWREKRRIAIIALFGGKCCRCGFDDARALQVDHVNGGGHAHRKSGISLWSYYDEIERGDRTQFQLLCANCNQIKKYENGEVRKPKLITPR